MRRTSVQSAINGGARAVAALFAIVLCSCASRETSSALVSPSTEIKPLQIGEVWSCSYGGFRGATGEPSTQHSTFRVSGSVLIQDDDEKLNEPFRILENSQTAIVAANGGTYNFFEKGPGVAASVVMIKKDSGDLVFAILAVGPANERTTGKCHLQE